jgi:hypothetical protein
MFGVCCRGSGNDLSNLALSLVGKAPPLFRAFLELPFGPGIGGAARAFVALLRPRAKCFSFLQGRRHSADCKRRGQAGEVRTVRHGLKATRWAGVPQGKPIRPIDYL